MIERLLCKTIGCTSLLANYFEWPHRLCDWYCWRKETKRIEQEVLDELDL